MKKLSEIGHSIAKFFDKHIVIPITRLVLKITNSFDKSSHKLESMLSKQSTLLFLSLFIAVALFIVVDQKILNLTTNSAKVFKNQKAEVEYDEERFVITGIPESFDITLIGSKTDLYIAEQSANHNVKLDLSNIKEPGTYKIDVEYEIGHSSIDYSVNPSQVTVVVYQKEYRNKSLSYNVINKDHLDATLEVSNVDLNIDQVVISGADFQLDKVATVEALIDVDKLTSLKEGTQTLRDIILKAYDKDGNTVDVEIYKEEDITAEVTITSSSREVQLNFVPVNKVPFGNAISSYAFSQNTVTVYGSTEVLDQLEQSGIDIQVDVSKLTSDYEAEVEIPKPSGVKQLSTNKVKVTIQVTESSEPVSLVLKVDALNTPKGWEAGAASEDDTQVLVDLQGAYNIIHSIKEEEIQAYVDLSELDLSNYSKDKPYYDVPIKIRALTANARLVNPVPKKETVRIFIQKS